MLDVPFLGLKASLVAWNVLSGEAYESLNSNFDQKKYQSFFSAVHFFKFLGGSGSGSALVFSLKCWFRIRNQWIQIWNVAFLLMSVLPFAGCLTNSSSYLYDRTPSSLETSIPDPLHFCVDPDPDPWIHASPSRRQQKTNLNKSFSVYYFWRYIYIIFQR